MNEIALHGSAQPLDGPLDFAAEQARMDAEDALRDSSIETLLRTAYSLTHRMHELQTSAFYSDDVQRVRDLRSQRDLIDAEIARRCES